VGKPVEQNCREKGPVGSRKNIGVADCHFRGGRDVCYIVGRLKAEVMSGF